MGGHEGGRARGHEPLLALTLALALALHDSPPVPLDPALDPVLFSCPLCIVSPGPDPSPGPGPSWHSSHPPGRPRTVSPTRKG